MATKITLRPKGATDSSSDVVLADGADRADDNVRGPARAEVSVAIAVQQLSGIRAAAARFFSRANRAGSYTFTSSRRFSNLADAGRFLLTHGTTCPADGTLIVDYGDEGDLVLLLDACLRQIGPMTQTGVTVVASYSASYSMAATAAEASVQGVIDAYAVSPIAPLNTLKINCGADLAVGTWLPDTYDYGGVLNYYWPDAPVENAGAVPLDVYFRYVALVHHPGKKIQYSIPLDAGDYDVKLYLCAYTENLSYVMDIAYGGSNVSSGYDVSAQAGGFMKANVFSWPANGHPGGNFVITCTPSGIGKVAVLCGIEITPK